MHFARLFMRFILVSLVLLSIQSVLAQSFSVKGTVVSAEDNEPMIGVTIMQEGLLSQKGSYRILL